MALIKYSGKENVVVTINGERKLIKPNKIFSGPESFKTYENFEILGYTKEEVGKKSDRNEKSLKLEIKSYCEPEVDFDVLDEDGAPKVSICIITKDSNGIIQKCIESIIKHVKYHDYEILLCDTGTTQEEVKASYKQWLNDYSYKIKIFEGHQYNFSANNNFLESKSSGSVILFMNSDIFLTYDAVSEMVKYILCSNIGCVGHRLVWDASSNEIQHDGQYLFDDNGKWRGPGHHNYKRQISEVSNENVIVEGVTAAFLMIRRSLFNKVGGFDEGYKDIYQDVDLNLKVRKAGYENFCIRTKPIIHVDHATRVNDQTKESPLDFQKFKMDWVLKGDFPVKKKSKYSILVCATNKKQLKTLLESIKSRISYEFVYLNNTSNYLWSSEALNTLTEVSNGEFLFWMHQDVTFDAYEPFATVSDIITKLGGSFGIIGPAGIQVGGKGAIRGVDFSSIKYNFDFLRVQTLDEFCLIGKKSNKIKFSEYLDHFHFYGADICCKALEKGMNNYVIKIPITHHSGGDVNLKKRGGYESYLKQGRKFLKKWKDRFPYISTTTMHFRKDNAFWYLGKMLGLEPNNEILNWETIDETPNTKEYMRNIVEEYLNKTNDGISVIILNKDKPDMIKKCISLLREHNKQENVELIIGDTGSTDIEVKKFYETLDGEKVKVVNIGAYHFSKNNNLLASGHAKYNKVLFLNNDVFVNSDITSKMSSLINGKNAIVGMKLLYEDGTVQHAGVEMVISKERNPNEWYLPEHIDYKKENTRFKNEIVDCVTGACLMVPKELFLQFGGFDEKFDAVFQDVDFCLKLKREGFRSICCNENYAVHLESATRNPEINTKDYNTMTARWGTVKY